MEGRIRPVDLQCERLRDPLGIDAKQPRLGWKIEAQKPDAKNLSQSAYHVLVASRRGLLQAGRGDLWDSGIVTSSETLEIEYGGVALGSRQSCFWKARAWDQDGRPSPWSRPASWTMGLLHPSDWHADWMGHVPPADGLTQATGKPGEWALDHSAPIFRKEFAVRPGLVRATATVCGLGYHELRLNGRKVSDRELDPPFTRYDARCLYVTHEVTRLLRPGANAAGIMLGNGWLNVTEKDEWKFAEASWRQEPRFIFNLLLEYADGTAEEVVGDRAWRATGGPIVRDGIRNGEWYDATREHRGWDRPGFDDSAWDHAMPVPGPGGALKACMMPPVKVMSTLEAVAIGEPRPGVFVFDFGRNIAGRVCLRLRAPRRTAVTLRYGERLAADGSLDTSKIDVFVYDGPFQTDRYVAKGRGVEEWESRFTYHGFRYVEVSGLPDRPTIESLRARVLHTAFEESATFESSEPLLGDIVQLTQGAYRGNFVGIPTDCPHREKNGWTGDAQLAAEMAMFCFKNAPAYEKWLNDFDDQQRDAGDYPGIVPAADWGWEVGPAWDGASVLIPWYLYVYHGDKRVLADHFDRMKRYVDFLTGRAERHLVSYGLSDWCPAATETPNSVTSTAYYSVFARTVARVAEILGHRADAERYRDLAEHVRRAFVAEFIRPDGTVGNGSQTSQAFALYQGMAEPDQAEAIVAKLVADIESKDGHLDFGILGAKTVFRTLSDHGRHEIAYRMATHTTFPSYGDWLGRGATTLWEDWRGENSLNHVMFGDIVAWFIEYLAGIRPLPDFPGFARFEVRPRPVEGLTWVKARFDSPRGPIASDWIATDGSFALHIQVPPNSTALVRLPIAQPADVTSDAVVCWRADGDTTVAEVGSGDYRFSVAVSPR